MTEVRVRLLTRLIIGGARMRAGETVTVSPELAEALVERGDAVFANAALASVHPRLEKRRPWATRWRP